MKLSRREMLSGTVAAGASAALGAPLVLAAEDDEPKVGPNGLYTQDWFIDSFLNLNEDVAEAAEAGKNFVIFWEQRGCPYCRETHRVNLAKPEIRDYIIANYNVLQLDLNGPRKVTDFDGKEMGERELALRWRVSFTPTLVFFSKDPKTFAGKTGKEAEVFRVPGYFKPFHFLSAFEYVRAEAYAKLSFQQFLRVKADKLREQGVEVKLW